MSDVARIQPEKETANELKQRIRLALSVCLEIMDEATRNGMVIQFQLGVDGFGRNVISALNVVKVL